MQRPSPRASQLALLLIGLAGACAQTDVIASGASPQCLYASDCAGTHGCPARACANPPANGCARALPLLSAGDGCSELAPEQPAFRYALCSCSDVVSRSPITLDAWNSQSGAVVPAGAALGVNGALDLQGALRVDGSVQLTRPPGSELASGSLIRGLWLEHANPACNCQASNRLDISALVAEGANDNANATLGLAPTRLDGFSGSQALSLSCGRYYLTRIAGAGDLRVLVQGRVQLLVAGNLELDRSLVFELASGAGLELVVSGNVRVTGELRLGTRADAPNARMYVGGAGTLDLGGTTTLAGALYAPQAELVTRAPLTSYGAIFVRRAALGASLQVTYDVMQAQPVSCTAATDAGSG